jgi:hypothetical protein
VKVPQERNKSFWGPLKIGFVNITSGCGYADAFSFCDGHYFAFFALFRGTKNR